MYWVVAHDRCAPPSSSAVYQLPLVAARHLLPAAAAAAAPLPTTTTVIWRPVKGAMHRAQSRTGGGENTRINTLPVF